MKTTRRVITALLFICILLLTACGAPAPASAAKPKTAMLSLNANEIVSFKGTSFIGVDKAELEEKTDIEYYDSLANILLELSADYADGAIIPSITAEYTAAKLDGYKARVLPDTMVNFQMALKAENSELRDRFNTAIAALRENGTAEALVDTWIVGVAAGNEPAGNSMTVDAAATETIKVGITGDFAPLDYIDAAGNPSGFNVAYLSAIAEYLHINIELVPTNAEARMTALLNGKTDVVFWLRNYGSNGSSEGEGIITTVNYFSTNNSLLYKAAKADAVSPLTNLADELEAKNTQDPNLK